MFLAVLLVVLAAARDAAASQLVLSQQVRRHAGRSGLWGDALRRPPCRSLLGSWAIGASEMAAVCRQAFGDVACGAAERLHGPDVGDADLAAQVDRVCGAVEMTLARRPLLLGSARPQPREGRAAVWMTVPARMPQQGLPLWAREAPVIQEEGEWSESPYPIGDSGSTDDGPRLTPSAQEEVFEQWNRAHFPCEFPPRNLTACELRWNSSTTLPPNASAAQPNASGG